MINQVYITNIKTLILGIVLIAIGTLLIGIGIGIGIGTPL